MRRSKPLCTLLLALLLLTCAGGKTGSCRATGQRCGCGHKNNLRHIRFHDLRHTCASLLLANGVPMEQVKEWLGHSEISTTVDIYGHLQYATKKQSAAAIEQDIVAPMLQNLSAVSP